MCLWEERRGKLWVRKGGGICLGVFKTSQVDYNEETLAAKKFSTSFQRDVLVRAVFLKYRSNMIDSDFDSVLLSYIFSLFSLMKALLTFITSFCTLYLYPQIPMVLI